MKFPFAKHVWLSSIEISIETMGQGKTIKIELPFVRSTYRVYENESDAADKPLSDLLRDCTATKFGFQE